MCSLPEVSITSFLPLQFFVFLRLLDSEFPWFNNIYTILRVMAQWSWPSDFYVMLTVHPCIIFLKWSQPGTHYFLVYLFQLLYMFRATMWLAGMRLIPTSRPDSHPYIPVSHWYSKSSWWWAHSCPKHVENFEINILRISVNLVGFIWKKTDRSDLMQFWVTTGKWSIITLIK